MSIGIDLGNDYMVVTAVRQGVDVLQNDVGKRKTRMAVTYNADNREIGDDAFSQYLSKFNMSAMYFKRLLGKQYGLDDEDIEKEKRFLPNKFSPPASDGSPSTVKFVIPRVGEVPPEQALCTMLLKAKQIYEINSEGQHVQECVITVPTSWGNAQRLAMMHAADMAQIKVLELANETTCLLYQYGLQRDIEDTRIVMFFDIGATSTSCTLARITKETGEVLAYESNPHLGGRDFIECIVEEVVKYCKEKKSITIEPNSKAWLKIRRACEKTFHTLSANHQASCSVENVLDGVDISVPYTRESFYAILEERFKDQIVEPVHRIIAQYPDLMRDGKLQVNFFEIIGGVTRVPLVQKLLVDTFGVTLSKTLDADEAIARGAALRCAALSTTKKIRRKFQVTDKRIAVELFLNKAPEGTKEGDALEKIKLTEENIILTKSFHAAYPITFPQPRLLSLKFQQVQLPVIVSVRLNGSKHDNIRSLILPQSRIDGRLLEETACGNVPVDLKVSLSLNSSGYLNVYNVETVPQKIETPAPTPVETPAQTEVPAPAAPTANEGENTTMGDDNKEAQTTTAEGDKTMDDKKDEQQQQQPTSPTPALDAPHEPVQHAEQPTMTDTPASPTPVSLAPQKPIPLVTATQTLGSLNQTDLDAARASEKNLQERDAATQKRQEVYNNLESHLFTTRSRLNDSNDLPQFMTPEQVTVASDAIKKTLDWLDDEGYCAELKDLESKLAEVQKLTNDANSRLHNWKNLESSQFAYNATLEVALAHQYITAEKFAKYVTAFQDVNSKAINVLKEGKKLENALAITSPQLDKANTDLRHMINAMNQYDPEKERQENLKRAAEEAQKKAAMEAQAAAAAAQKAAQQAAAAENVQEENAAQSSEEVEANSDQPEVVADAKMDNEDSSAANDNESSPQNTDEVEKKDDAMTDA
jgi:molecular chaperone DnaK (HSP70)